MRQRQSYGFTLLEVLITLVILAFGLLGLAGLQSTMHLAEVESYQRAQAVLLLDDMTHRIQASGAVGAAAYITDPDNPLGTGTADADCTALGGAVRDQCEWSDLLKGAAETKSSANVGAMVDARGCIDQVQVADPSAGVCAAGIYRVTVVWQGLNATAAPDLACGEGLYGTETFRRAVSMVITLGLPRCT